MKCWGYNSNGQLGDGSTTNRSSPVSFSGVSTAKDIAADPQSTCVLYNDGTVKCIGYNNKGQLGDGTTTDRTSLVSGTGITNGTKIIAGALNYCVLLSDSTIKCWGENAYGQLGNGTTTNSSSPVIVSGISNTTDITANGHLVSNHSVICALLSDKGAKCWGANGEGQAGSGSRSTNSPYSLTTPTLLYGL